MKFKQFVRRFLCMILVLASVSGCCCFAAAPETHAVSEEVSADSVDVVIMEEVSSGVYRFETQLETLTYSKTASTNAASVSPASIYEVTATLSGEYDEENGTLDVTVRLYTNISDVFNSAYGTFSYVTSDGTSSASVVSDDAGLFPDLYMELSKTFHWIYMTEDGYIDITVDGEYDMLLHAGSFFGTKRIEAEAYTG